MKIINIDSNDIIRHVRQNEGCKTKEDVNGASAERYFHELARQRAGKAPEVGGSRGCNNQGDVLQAALRAQEVRASGIRQDQSGSDTVGRVGDDCGEAPSDCGGDILGFNSLAAATFPIASVAARTVVTNATALTVGSGNADAYKAREFFFEGRDGAAGFGVIPSLLISAEISGNQQLVSSAAANGIPSSVFALTNEPLPVKWRKFANTGQQQLLLTFGIYLAAGVQADFFGVMWGDRAERYM